MSVADPEAGPLDPVFACPGCFCLVVDGAGHERVCSGRDGATAVELPALGPQIVEWLDTLNPAEVAEAAYAEAGFDEDPTAAVFERLKKLAAAL